MTQPWGTFPPDSGGTAGPPGPPGPPGGGAVIAQYIWRPGGVPSATVLTTWAAVEAAITANLGSVLILTDASLGALIVPAAASTECYGRAAFAPYDAGLGGADIQFADTAQIRNPASFRNTTLRGAPASINFLVLDIPNIQCILQEGSSIVLELGATVPAVHADVPGGQCQLVLLRGSTIVNQTGNAALAVVFIDATVQLIFAIVACVQAPLIGGCYPANAFSGGLTAALIILADASAPLVFQPNLASPIFSVVPDLAKGVAYDDSLVLPPLGANNVQEAIDELKEQPGNALPVVLVFASQVAPPGFAYVLQGNGIVLTLAAGTNNALVRVVNSGTGNSVVADIAAPDQIVDDAGTNQLAIDIDDYVTPGGTTYFVLREWQFVTGPNVWVRTNTQNTQSFLNGVLLTQEWTPGDPSRPGFTNVVTTAGQTIDTPDPATVGSGPSATFAICKFVAGALTVNAFAGSQFAAPDGAGFVTTYNADAWPAGSVFTWQYALSSNNYMLVSASPPPAPAVAYVPTTSADWAGDPATVQEALDRIAAAVAGLLAAPIP